MTFYIITLFPQMFTSVFSESIVARAIRNKKVVVKFTTPRDFATDSYHTVDDKPYGGGSGMVMKVEPIIKALEKIKPKPYTILLSASGKTFTQQTAVKLSKKENVAVICGHYEGVDARVEKFVDEVVSIGDYVLTGGEIPAMAIVDSVTRLIPGVIKAGSLENESFDSDMLEHPQYTRPEIFRGLKVPKVLLGGNHAEVKKWRELQAGKRTKKFRKS